MSTDPYPRHPDLPARLRRPKKEERHRRYQRRAKVLLWRAALGAAYAAGTGVITGTAHWLLNGF
ncbi:hypothetical protein ACF1AY_38310 [Streptomyces sp. NPDC014776]|uniref:hypothetical protein n=1 Tax=unclassified Streptomyces TaxID=2593676 RepID=UPI0036FF1428